MLQVTEHNCWSLLLSSAECLALTLHLATSRLVSIRISATLHFNALHIYSENSVSENFNLLGLVDWIMQSNSLTIYNV